MKIFYILFVPIFIFLLTSCSENTIENQASDKGTLFVSVDEIDAVVEDFLLTKAHSTPDVSLFTVKISSEDKIIYEGAAPTEPLTIDVGTYKIEAMYGSSKILSLNAPYYYTTQNLLVQTGVVHSVNLKPTLQCALVEVNVPVELTEQFSSYEIKSVCGEESALISNGDVLYVKPGESISITLSGVNTLGAQKSFTLASYTSVEASKKYIVNCKIPQITLPNQDVAKVWSMCATLYPTTISNIDGGNVESILSRIVHEYSQDNVNWSVVTPVDGEINLNGLQSNTTYYFRSRYENIICSNPYTFTTEEQIALPYGDMETWGSGGATNLVFVGPSNNSYWAARNTQTTSSGVDAWYTKNSGTSSDGDAVSGKAAKLTTIGWGSGNTWAGLIGTAVVKNVSGAWLLVGSVNTSGEITKGRPHSARPTNLQFSYKYAPKNGSSWRVEVQVISNGTVIGEAVWSESSSVGGYTTKNMVINYSNENLKATDIYIFFTDNTKGGLGKNDISKLSNPNRYEGSVLKLDNIELIYNK